MPCHERNREIRTAAGRESATRAGRPRGAAAGLGGRRSLQGRETPASLARFLEYRTDLGAMHQPQLFAST
jgi:hypothetical protein